MDLETYQQIQPWAQNADIKFFTPNTHVAWRVQSLLTKEPDTINWINNFPQNSIFIDVGANIGQYSLYAAKHNHTVYAFEPESQNFALLQRNIVLNDMQQHVTAWPICLSDSQKLSVLHLSSLMIGGSCHAFDKPLDYHGNTKQWPAIQGSFALRLDDVMQEFILQREDLLSKFHLKIDVDGFEHLVIAGASESMELFDSVLIEINTHYPEHMQLVEHMLDIGFHYDPAQVNAARRTEGAFAGVGNYIFYRD